MVYSDKARVFLTRHGMEPERVDMEAAVAAFLCDAELGLAGRGGDMMMLPTYLTADGVLPPDTPAAVIDAGGTNFRTARVSFGAAGATIEDMLVSPMPGTLGEVSWDEFIDFAARRVAPLLESCGVLGFCFSFPSRSTPELDAEVIRIDKQLRITGAEGRLICADLSARLAELGLPGRRMLLVNDTPAVLLSGAHLGGADRSGLVGMVSGTGTNACCSIPCQSLRGRAGGRAGSMLVNFESGAFEGLPQGDFDAALDASTVDPGTFRNEKMTGGAYLGRLCTLTLRGAAAEGLLTPGGADALLASGELDTPAADALACGASRGPFADEGDAALSGELCAALFDRAARCVCADLAAILTLTDSGGDGKSACICADGSLYRRSRVFRPALEGYMRSFTAERLGRRSEFFSFDNATLLGSAAAALLNNT